MRQYLGEPNGPIATDQDAKRLAMQKMAFEVAWRIVRVTPVNATGLVSALLLTARGVALTVGQLHHTFQDVLDYLERKEIPMTNSVLRLRTPEGVRSAVDALSGGHPVTRVDGGRQPVWLIAPDDEHEAAFYRNSIIYAFLETSIIELALAHASRAESAWPEAIRAILQSKKPLLGAAMLRPFFEAYEIVADVLRDAAPAIPEAELTKLALGVGRQHVAQAKVRSAESASALLFATAQQVVADQDLLRRAPDLSERRAAFLTEMRDILADMDTVEVASRDQFTARELASRRSTGR